MNNKTKTSDGPIIPAPVSGDGKATRTIAWQIANDCWLSTVEKASLAKRIRRALDAALAGEVKGEPVAVKALLGAQEALSTTTEWFSQRELKQPTTNAESAIFARLAYVLDEIDAALSAAPLPAVVGEPVAWEYEQFVKDFTYTPGFWQWAASKNRPNDCEDIQNIRPLYALPIRHESPKVEGAEAEGPTYGQKLIAEAIQAHFGEWDDGDEDDPEDTTRRDVWEAYDAWLSRPALKSDAVGALIEALKPLVHLSTPEARSVLGKFNAALSSTPDEPDDEHFLEAYVSKDGHVVGIDHPTEADWHTVLAAHIAFRDRLNERIAEQENCPHKPSTPDEPSMDRSAHAMEDVAAERRRQVYDEGWTPEHDDAHSLGELAKAAASYAAGSPAWTWPWDKKWWKPTDRRRDLVKAGALIVAEIERLDRAAAKHGG